MNSSCTTPRAVLSLWLFSLAVFGVLLSLPAHAKALEVSGWIPYWRVADGVRSAQKNLSALDEINPFVFTVMRSGALKDQGHITGRSWKKLFAAARSNDVRIIPTIMTGDGALVHTVLSNDKTRAKHVRAIVAMVDKGSFDGVDIDYEGKKSETKEYFSLFLKELNRALGERLLMCTIEARTPPESLYREVPQTIAYVNDLEEINEHCDRVRVMAYDQQRADILLNDARKGAPYIPVADVDWVRKVIELMMQSIDNDKLVLGVPTYGVEWELTVAPEWYQRYARLWSLNPGYAVKEAKKLGITPVRNSAGELSVTYSPKGVRIPSSYRAPAGTPEAYEAAERALAYATETGKTTLVNIMWWSDAQAIKDKVDLAEELGLRGIAIFKIDGGEDPALWKLFR